MMSVISHKIWQSAYFLGCVMKHIDVSIFQLHYSELRSRYIRKNEWAFFIYDSTIYTSENNRNYGVEMRQVWRLITIVGLSGV